MPFEDAVARTSQDQATRKQIWRIKKDAERRGYRLEVRNACLTKGLASAVIEMLLTEDPTAHEAILNWLPNKGFEVEDRRQITVEPYVAFAPDAASVRRAYAERNKAAGLVA